MNRFAKEYPAPIYEQIADVIDSQIAKVKS